MKPRHRLLLASLVLLLGAAGYARQWPLELSTPDAGAYRVTVEDAVYRAATDPALRDVDVLDAEGRAVPAMPLRAEDPAAAPPVRVPLAWFALPDPRTLPNSALEMAAERSSDGRVLKVQMREQPAASAANAMSWLVDAGEDWRRVHVLHLQFAAGPDFEVAVRVEGSADLQQWQTLAGRIVLLRLARDGRSLEQGRLQLSQPMRYLRIVPATPGLPALAAVQAEHAAAGVPDHRWMTLAPVQVSADRRSFEFELQGRFPLDRADVALEGNAAASWRLESRESAEDPWQPRVGSWTVFRLGTQERSAPRAWQGALRHRHWRLLSSVPVDPAPRLKLGWRPEQLVFVASGQPPYRLVAGSARSQRATAPIPDLLAQMRSRRGQDWQPASAQVQGEGQSADPAALQPARDWKSILLWGVLLLAALSVAMLAVRLLRGRPGAPPPEA